MFEESLRATRQTIKLVREVVGSRSSVWSVAFPGGSLDEVLPPFWNSLPGAAAPGRKVFKEAVFPNLEPLLKKSLTGPAVNVVERGVAIIISEHRCSYCWKK